MLLQLVVARYSEDLSWLRNIPGAVAPFVYDKGDALFPGAVPLVNAGREAHTYLHHICERYNDLADVTVFCQGKPFDHAFDFHQTLRGLAMEPESAPLSLARPHHRYGLKRWASLPDVEQES
jgi:hypothetical protein